MADALDGETARPLPALGGLEPINGTLRRLIGSSVVVGLASVSRRHERPSRMAVSRRSGTLRPPPRAARLQARVGSGSASPPPVEPTNLASHGLLCQFGLAGLVSAGRRADAASLGHLRGGAIGPNFGGTLGRCRTVLRSATQAKSPLRPGLVCLGRLATYRLRRSCTAASGADAPDPFPVSWPSWPATTARPSPSTPPSSTGGSPTGRGPAARLAGRASMLWRSCPRWSTR